MRATGRLSRRGFVSRAAQLGIGLPLAASLAKISGQSALAAPSLMLQDGGTIAAQFGYPVEVIYIIIKAVLAIGLLGVAVVGYLVGTANWFERLAACAVSILLMLALPWTDELGFALAVVLVGQHWWRLRSPPAAPAV